jgi:hypothetical protein
MLVVERHDFFLNGEKGGVVHGLRIMNLLEMNYLCLQRQGIYLQKVVNGVVGEKRKKKTSLPFYFTL